MTGFFFWTFVALLLLPLVKAIELPERVYHYPYFMAAVFAVFVLPQAVSLVRFPGAAPEQAVRNVLLVTCLCLGACLPGYHLAAGPPAARRVSRAVDETRLFHAGLVFVACGLAFSHVLAHTDIQTNEFGGWTGPATIYGFFQQLCYPGFAICLMVALRQPGLFSIGSVLVAAVVPMQSILFGRREPAVLFLLTIGLTFYFQWGLKPARWIIATVLGFSLLAVPATATYRRFQLEGDWQAVRHIDLVSHFKDFLNEESVLELRNAAMLIEATRRSGEYELGAGYWNHLVFRYIPGQLLGAGFKESLMLPVHREGLERELSGMDYVNPTGSTVTAMGDSFQQFGYFGCLFFLGTGLFFRRLWPAAASRNALLAQLLYIQSCTCAMRAVTHWTLDFLPGLAYNFIFLGAAAVYAGAEERLTRRSRGRPPRVARSRLDRPGLLAQHPGDDENKNRAPQPASQ